MTAEEIKKFVFHLDALKYSFQMANLVSSRIRETLDDIAKNHPDKYTEEQVTSGLLDAWTLIDICHRIRAIIEGMPRLSRKLPGIQIFLRGTEQVESLRNYAQHFRNEISNIPLESNPLWGALSWTPSKDKTRCLSIFSGNLVGGVTAHLLVLDSHTSEFLGGIKLLANGIEIDLIDVSEHLVNLKLCLSEWLAQLKNPKIEQIQSKTLVLAISPKK
jgi:hypothetical protein